MTDQLTEIFNACEGRNHSCRRHTDTDGQIVFQGGEIQPNRCDFLSHKGLSSNSFPQCFFHCFRVRPSGFFAHTRAGKSIHVSKFVKQKLLISHGQEVLAYAATGRRTQTSISRVAPASSKSSIIPGNFLPSPSMVSASVARPSTSSLSATKTPASGSQVARTTIKSGIRVSIKSEKHKASLWREQ